MVKGKNAEENRNETPLGTTLFAVRTTIGQEKGVLQLIFNKLRVMNPFPDIKVMMISEQLRGYVFVEATHQRDVLMLIAGVPHIKGKVVGSIKLDSIAHVISPRRVTEVLEEGDTVEIISGLFKDQKAQVIRMPKEGAKEDVTLRLLDSDSAISIKMHGDFLKLIAKGEKHKDRYIMKKEEPEEESEGVEGEPKKAPVSAETLKAEEPIPVIKADEPLAKAANPEAVFSFEEEKKIDSEMLPGNVIIKDKSEQKKAKEAKKGKEKDKEKEAEKEAEKDEEEDDEWSKFSF